MLTIASGRVDLSALVPGQCRAARALLGWTQAELAARSGVGATTIRGFEQGRHVLIRSNMAAIRATLEANGVVFVHAEGIGPGVVFRAAAGSAA